MKLIDLFKGIEILEINRDIDMNSEITGVEYDSRNINKDEVFVAVRGYVTDGHKFIGGALKNGASFAVVEEFTEDDIIEIKVKDSRSVLSDLAANFFEQPSEKIDIIGITATNGKTTTSFMVESVLKEAKFVTGIIGTVMARYADVKIPSILTTPESRDLQYYFWDMKRKNIDKVIMEVSSSGEETGRVRNIDFDILTFNNFSREHIDQHGSFENYYNEKSKFIKNANPGSVAVLNMDFDKIAVLKDNTKAHVLTYSLENDNYDFGIKDLDLSTGKGKFTFVVNRDIKCNLKGKDVEIKKQEFDINLSVAGYSSVMNSVVAIIVGLLEGIDVNIIQSGIKRFSGVERRFEMIYDEDFQIIDDHFANVRNIEVTLSTLTKMKYNNLHVLYAIRGSRGVNLNRETSEVAAKWFKDINPENFYATLSEDTVTWKDEVTSEEKKVFYEVMNKNGFDPVLFKTLEEPVRDIVTKAKKGDVILFAGCQGMDKAAGFAIDEIIKKGFTKNPEKLLERVKNRVC